MSRKENFQNKLKYFLESRRVEIDPEVRTSFFADIKRLGLFIEKNDKTFNVEVVDYLNYKYPFLSNFWNTYISPEVEKDKRHNDFKEAENLLGNL